MRCDCVCVSRGKHNPPTPWSPKAKGKARGEAAHSRETKLRHELRWLAALLPGTTVFKRVRRSGSAYLAIAFGAFRKHSCDPYGFCGTLRQGCCLRALRLFVPVAAWFLPGIVMFLRVRRTG